MKNLINIKNIKTIPGGVTAPAGFSANGINAGIRDMKLDLGVIFSENPCTCAGSFTKNIVKAAPVRFSSRNIKNKIQALAVNSGTANACTGEKGYSDAVKTAQILSQLLSIQPENVLVFSTGVIGKYLDMKKIEAGLKKLVPLLSKEGHDNISKAILTTDTIKKEIAVEFMLKGKKIKLGAMAKGAGMIAPNMATLLVFITSDINIERNVLVEIFKNITRLTLNKITIDGDMSTNDSAVILCNGMAKNDLIKKSDKKEIAAFTNNLYFIMDHLAKMLVIDGEGATKFIKINILNSKTENEALKIGFKIANSPLVKTAFYGCDANWGRILAAAGSSGVQFNPDKIEIKFGQYPLFKNGHPVRFSEQKLKKYLSQNEIVLYFNINTGKKNIIIYTSDLTEDYIKINAHYRS